MKKQRILFSGGLFILITAICLFIYPVATSLVVYTPTQKQGFLDRLQPSLEALAVEQARILDPNYDWITVDGNQSNETKEAIKEMVLTNQKTGTINAVNQNLASDSNLAWITTYKGETFKHNWKSNYSTDPGSLDIEFTSTPNGIKVTQKALEGLNPNSVLLGVDLTALLNPNLPNPNADNSDSKYTYRINLPENFSIRFHAPSVLKANGSILAKEARPGTLTNYMIIMAGGWLVIFLYILLWNKEVERDSFIFSRFIKMKTVGCWLVLIFLMGLFTYSAPVVSYMTATGEIREKLYSMGMDATQISWIIPTFCFMVWFIYYSTCSLCSMYIKYIFAYGIGRYMREDSVIAAIMKSVAKQAEDTARIPLNRWTSRKVIPTLILADTLILGAIMIGTTLFSLGGAIVSVLIVSLLLLLAVRRVYKLWYQDYMITLQTAQELSEGNFSNVEPRQVGAFQNLYDAVIDVKSGFQTALKEGLANQQMKTQLISNVSHDLKTPVTGIKSYAELITLTDNIDDIHSYSKKLQNYTDRLSALIEDLFDVARANSGDIKLHPVTINLSELVEQVVVEWEDTLAKKQLHIVLDLPAEALTTVDPDKTMRIVDNLISNVNKYALENTRVFVTLKELDDCLQLSCKNISKTPLDFDASTITERFVRGDKSRHEPGTGLGLAIVKSFTEVQKGTCLIEVDGDLFKAILTFPKDEPVPEEPAAEETAETEETILPETIG